MWFYVLFTQVSGHSSLSIQPEAITVVNSGTVFNILEFDI